MLDVGDRPRFEFADMRLRGGQQLGEVVIVHAEHDSAAAAQLGIRHTKRQSSPVPILARRVPLHGVNVDTIQRPVQLLGRQPDHRLLAESVLATFGLIPHDR